MYLITVKHWLRFPVKWFVLIWVNQIVLFSTERSCFPHKRILHENYFNILRMMFAYINYALYLLYLWTSTSFHFHALIESNDVFGNHKWLRKAICDSNVTVPNRLRFFTPLWTIFKQAHLDIYLKFKFWYHV